MRAVDPVQSLFNGYKPALGCPSSMHISFEPIRLPVLSIVDLLYVYCSSTSLFRTVDALVSPTGTDRTRNRNTQRREKTEEEPARACTMQHGSFESSQAVPLTEQSTHHSALSTEQGGSRAEHSNALLVQYYYS